MTVAYFRPSFERRRISIVPLRPAMGGTFGFGHGMCGAAPDSSIRFVNDTALSYGEELSNASTSLPDVSPNVAPVGVILFRGQVDCVAQDKERIRSVLRSSPPNQC